MSEIAIRVEQLSKQYTIGLKRNTSLVELVNSFFQAKQTNKNIFWALKDISFEVKQGEVLGIIGKNGAGKSTLLKILARITTPSSGNIKIKGRINSLLEIGTGFHSELSGKENVFLNGTILGMKRQEIKQKFDEIVDFSGIGKFLDTPVKHYSSGMYVRLAFAVAAHLEPEILLIDEVLAVGDTEFQKKCIEKLQEIYKLGKTLLVVSHNATLLKAICTKAVLLEEGKIKLIHGIDEVLYNYLGYKDSDIHHLSWNNKEEGLGNADFRLKQISIKAKNKSLKQPITIDDEVEIKIEFWKLKEKNYFNVTLQFKDNTENYLFAISTVNYSQLNTKAQSKGLYQAICVMPANFFNSCTFKINLLIIENKKIINFRFDNLLIFSILEKKKESDEWMGKSVGFLRPHFDWNMKLLNEF